jgi:membrane-bound lytic murein transglycosylase A
MKDIPAEAILFDMYYMAKDPVALFFVEVQGSGTLRLPDGSERRIGYAASNGRPYRSIGSLLIQEGVIPREAMSMQALREWLAINPTQCNRVLDFNESYVFFTPIDGNPRGSLNVPVIAARSLATDKTLFPRGAVTFVDTKPGAGGADVHDFLLDQDTGGAIRTAGRADIYLGIGEEAEQAAGRTKAEGQLYYLFLKEGRPQS